MIAGGSSGEALRYGVASDLGHPGLVIQEGVGLFGGGIVGRTLILAIGSVPLVVAPAPGRAKRFSVGICGDSAVVASDGGMRLGRAPAWLPAGRDHPGQSGVAQRQLRRAGHPAQPDRPRRPGETCHDTIVRTGQRRPLLEQLVAKLARGSARRASTGDEDGAVGPQGPASVAAASTA